MQSLKPSLARPATRGLAGLASATAGAPRASTPVNTNAHIYRPLRQASDKAVSTSRPSSRNAPSLGSRHRQSPAKKAFSPNSVPSAGRSWYSTTTPPVARDPTIHDIFDKQTGSWQYIVADPSSLSAVIIDPVLDYDANTGTISTSNADQLLSLIKEKGYRVDMILETHAHADHLTAASYLQKQLSASQGIDKPFIAIGKRITQVQKMFGQRYGVPLAEYDGIFDKLFDDDEAFHVGGIEAMAMHIPGHTPDHMGYRIGDNVFVGDSLFHTDLGSARADFPGGSATALYSSGRKLLALPPNVRIWIGHDYPPLGRDAPVSSMTVQEHKELNKHFKDSVSEQEYVDLRHKRDAGLAAPKFMHPSLQVNIRAGRLPTPTDGGQRMLHLPLKLQEVAPW